MASIHSIKIGVRIGMRIINMQILVGAGLGWSSQLSSVRYTVLH